MMGAGASDNNAGAGSEKNTDDRVGVTAQQTDGFANQHREAAAKMRAVNAFKGVGANSGANNAPAGDDDKAWQEEQQRQRQQQQQQQQQRPPPPPPQSSSPNGVSGPPPPAPKKKKLLNGTNIEYRYPSGSVYVGGFKDGKLHGFGKYKYHPSGDCYEGEWVSDMKHGQGTYTYDCGDRYVGDWRSGKKHGRGEYHFVSGDQYVGGWREDKIHGYGVFHIAKNGNRYEGHWADSYRHGFGILYCGNGDCYEGNWLKGKEHGAGVLTYANGSLYAGEWKAGQMDGKGIMVTEAGEKQTVEHIAGYCIARVPIDEEATVDPDWNAANELYLSHKAKQKAKEAQSITGGGSGVANAEAQLLLEQTRKERDSWEKKYKELLAQKAGSQTEDSDDEIFDVEELKTKLARVKEQRDMEKRRAEEHLLSERRLDAEVQELKFNLQKLDDVLAENERLKSEGSAGHGTHGMVSVDERDRLQRKVVELEKELHNHKPGGEKSGGKAEATELRAKLELMEGEVKMLKSSRDELQKIREQNLDAQQTVIRLEAKNEELMREINVQRQRAQHLSSEMNDTAQRTRQEQQEEVRELRAEVQDLKVASMQAEETAKKMRGRLKEMEERAKRAAELEVQVQTLKSQKSNDTQSRDKRSDEIDSLRQQNAELSRKLEEATIAGGGTAVGAGSSSAAVVELQAKIDALEKDHKKDKKKHKKVQQEKDEIQEKANKLQAEVSKARRELSAIEGKITVFGKLRRVTQQEQERQLQSTAAVEVDAIILKEGDKPMNLDVCFGPSAKPEEIMEECKNSVRAVPRGYNVSFVMLGPMQSGKTFLASQLVPLLVQELYKACDAAAGTAYQTSVQSQCLELTSDGIFDGNNPDSTGTEIQLLKDPFGSVVPENATTQPCGAARDVAVDFSAAVGRRRKQRSHLIYSLHVILHHKVTDAEIRGRLTVCDLAGPGSLGDQASDVESAKYVNKSIVSLNKVISSLATPGQNAVPYRDDPLTCALADTLGGNARTTAIVVLGPTTGGDSYENASQALKTGQSMAAITNLPLRRYESADLARLRNIVASVHSPEEAQPKLTEIASLRE